MHRQSRSTLTWFLSVPSLHSLLTGLTLIFPQITLSARPSALDEKIQSVLAANFGCSILVIDLSQVSRTTIPPRCIVVATLESEQPLLNTMNGETMELVKIITNNASKIIWITNADLLSGARPDSTPVLGLSRALMLEQPSLQFSVFDVDNVPRSLDITARNIGNVVRRLMEDVDPDFELAQKGGVIHTPRWEPEEALNAMFRLKQNGKTVDMPLETVGRCKLNIDQPGQMSTLHFVVDDYGDAVQADYVEVQVKSVGMNAKVSLTRWRF